jgi:hypothetical protein
MRVMRTRGSESGPVVMRSVSISAAAPQDGQLSYSNRVHVLMSATPLWVPASFRTVHCKTNALSTGQYTAASVGAVTQRGPPFPGVDRGSVGSPGPVTGYPLTVGRLGRARYRWAARKLGSRSPESGRAPMISLWRGRGASPTGQRRVDRALKHQRTLMRHRLGSKGASPKPSSPRTYVLGCLERDGQAPSPLARDPRSSHIRPSVVASRPRDRHRWRSRWPHVTGPFVEGTDHQRRPGRCRELRRTLDGSDVTGLLAGCGDKLAAEFSGNAIPAPARLTSVAQHGRT